MSAQIATVEQPREVVVSETTAFISMIERAARDPNVDIDKMERLFQMQERAQARSAREAFASAFATMQADLPTIAERGVGDKRMKYALWEDVNDAIKPVLAQHGFGISFKTGRTAERVTVTAILMHRGGHSEETTLELPIDTSGSKNAVQAVGSSTSYGKRYTASALLNLTSRDGAERDDDGRAAGIGASISEEQAEKLRTDLFGVKGNLADFLAYFKIEDITNLPSVRLGEAQRMIAAKAAKGAAR